MDDNKEPSKDEETDTEDNEYEVIAFLQKDLLCSIQDKLVIFKSWILLDSQSMVDVFSRPRLLNNIHVTTPMSQHEP